MFDLWDKSFGQERSKAALSNPLRRFGLALVATGCVLASFAVPSAANPLILQGSTTFNRRAIEPHHVRTALQLISVVEQEPNAMGLAQRSLARQKGLPELATESPVEQSLSFVTLGEPTPQMKAVIGAARSAVEKSM